jgi:hypothetical protein
MPATNVLPNALEVVGEIDRNELAKTQFQQLQTLAIDNKGGCTKLFMQAGTEAEREGRTMTAELGLKKWYGKRNLNGVCKALCTYWIATHATDEDFWGWLQRDGGIIRVAQASFIIDAHVSYLGEIETGRNAAGEAWERTRLGAYDVIPQGYDGARKEFSVNQLTPYMRGHLLAARIAPDRRRWGYKSISVYRGGQRGHSLAAWVGNDVLFFDPNFGEFWFEDVRNFKKWFAQYWTITGNGKRYDRDYIVRSWGKSLTSKWARRSWM